jgi:hypothetical protein
MPIESNFSLGRIRTPDQVDQTAQRSNLFPNTTFGLSRQPSSYSTDSDVYGIARGTRKPVSLDTSMLSEYEKVNNNAIADINKPIETKPETTSGFTWDSGLSMASGMASGIAERYTADKANEAKSNMNKDLESWKAKGAYWFDPSYDIVPTFDEYIQGYPSAEKAMLDSQWFGGTNKGKTDQIVGGIFNPIGAAVTGASRAAGNTQLANRSGYAVQKGNEGALQGLSSGGWVGAIVGGVLGVVQGFFGYGSAIEDDKKTRQRMLAEYEAKYKNWQEQKRRQKEARDLEFAKAQAMENKQSYLNRENKASEYRTRRSNKWANMVKLSSGLGQRPKVAPMANTLIK